MIISPPPSCRGVNRYIIEAFVAVIPQNNEKKSFELSLNVPF